MTNDNIKITVDIILMVLLIVLLLSILFRPVEPLEIPEEDLAEMRILLKKIIEREMQDKDRIIWGLRGEIKMLKAKIKLLEEKNGI